MFEARRSELAHSLLGELCEKFPIGYIPRLVWRPYRVTAGMAYYRSRTIGLSSIVLKEETSLRETLIHEYAHLLAFYRRGERGKGHGEPWRQAMQDLGQAPRVRHSYEVSRNKARQQVDYQCLKCGATIMRKRRLPGRRRYIHAVCGGDLRLMRVVRVTATPQVA
jgi:predicted SprT family Zn-dependent metalloprotease